MLVKGVLLLLGWLTNLVFIGQVLRPLRGTASCDVRYMLVFFSGLLNLAIVFIFARSPILNAAVFAHVFEYPGVYLWLASFFLLGLICDFGRIHGRPAVKEERTDT